MKQETFTGVPFTASQGDHRRRLIPLFRRISVILAVAVLLVMVDVFAGPPSAHAAPLLPSLPLPENCPGGGSEWWQINYGVSYDAEYASTGLNDGYGEVFGFFYLWAPDIAGYSRGCLISDGTVIGSYVYLYFGRSGVNGETYNVSTTLNNETTTQSYSSNSDDLTPLGDYRVLRFWAYPGESYTFQVQACYAGGGCINSPQLTVTTYTNVSCVTGYVWREANPYDQVCVTPDQRTQVYNDNNLAASRVNPGGKYGSKACMTGYVWRNAFGGDYACVTPDERKQVASDNWYASFRIVATYPSLDEG